MSQSRATQSPSISKTGCCIVGAGPAGAVLALLLAKAGVAVTLIEAHRDFDREFRGDTVHPSTLDLLAQLGLAEKTLALSHSRVSSVTLETEEGPFSPLNLEGLQLAFPFIAIIPQARLLELLTHEASRYPNFRLLLSSTVQELVIEEGQVRGVRYAQDRATTELRADVVIAADGRFSKVRKLADLEPTTDGSPMDILWFRLPRESSDGSGLVGRNTPGRALVMIDRGSHWQVGYIIAKGGYQQLRAAGLQKLRSALRELAPFLGDRADTVTDWKEVSLLSVESSCCAQWYRPGLLLIGDAAHAMSPIGGVGINYAIQDAIATFHALVGPLRRGRVSLYDLDAVQERRRPPTRWVQWVQTAMARQVLGSSIQKGTTLHVPKLLRFVVSLKPVRRLLGQMLAYGPRPEPLDTSLFSSPS